MYLVTVGRDHVELRADRSARCVVTLAEHSREEDVGILPDHDERRGAVRPHDRNTCDSIGAGIDPELGA
jgi:hypothetical protein